MNIPIMKKVMVKKYQSFLNKMTIQQSDRRQFVGYRAHANIWVYAEC